MISVRFPPHLRRFVKLPAVVEVDCGTLPELLDRIEADYSGVKGYLVHENGKLRQHVNLFVDGQLVVEKDLSKVTLEGVREMVIMQALSGG